MRKVSLLSVSLAIALALVFALSGNVLAGQKASVTGTIHCIDSNGNMSTKAGVCPAEHLAHVLITDDGRAIMLGGGEKMDKLIRNIAYPAGTKVTVRGAMSEELSAIEIEELVLSAGAAGGG